MARKGRGGTSGERASGSSDWPGVAAPAVLPEAGMYFWRCYSDGREELGGYHNFRHTWQMGRFLLEVLEGCEEIEPGPLPMLGGIEDERAGGMVSYLVVTERDADGSASKGRRFKAKLMGASFEEAIRLGQLHTDIRLPYHEDGWRRAAQGRPPRSYDAWEAGDDDSTHFLYKKPGGGTPAPETGRRSRRGGTAAPSPRPEPTERRERAPRASRDGLTTLTSICAEQGVEAGDVRAALRGMKIEKPASGWAWDGPVPDYVAKAIKVAKEKRK